MRTPEQALAEVQTEILTAPDLDDAERHILLEKAVADYQKHVAGGSGERIEKKATTKMDKAFRKLLIDAGPIASVKKPIYDEALKSLGEEMREKGDSDARAYVRALESPEGLELHSLYKRAAPADPAQDAVEQPKPAARGPANIEMDRLADAHLKAHPELGKAAFGRAKRDGGRAAAYTIVYSHPDNRELRDRVKGEDLAGVPRTPAGQTTVGRNPNWNADVRATMRRTSGP